MMTTLSELFTPLQIGPMRIENRVMMPGMSAGMMLDANCFPTPEMIAYYEERARARPGLIAIGSSTVVPPEGPEKFPVAMWHDGAIAALRPLVDAVHRHDVRFGIQIWDPGRQGMRRVQLSPSGVAPVIGASGTAAGFSPTVKVLTVDDIHDVVRNFGAAAARAEKAGFDFIEIHGGHGYLISAFLSPYFNRRTDAYGGSLENRARFIIEIMREVKRAVGNRIGLGVKINGDDYLPQGGFELSDAVKLAPMLEAEGADYLSVTACVEGASRMTVPPMYEKQGCFVDLAAAVKRAVKIPVATIGRVKSPLMANDIVKTGMADIICMGRAMIADPAIVDKARRGDIDDIRPCLADCRGCIDQEIREARRLQRGGNATCVVNPRMARESVCIDVEGNRSDRPRKVVVVGGGLAGLEAARRAAYSGHKVTLCERRSWLGGQIRLAAKMPGRTEIADMMPWYERQLVKHKVDVRLETTVDATLLDALKPDVVFVATGSVPQVPQNMLHLVGADALDAVLIDDVIEHGHEVGRNVLVVGGGQIGMQAADYLSEDGRTVVVAESSGHFASKLAIHDRRYLTERLVRKNVKRLKNVSDIVASTDGSITLVTDKSRETLAKIDTIVFASERHSERSIAEIAKARGCETWVIGDAASVNDEDSGMIMTAIAQAYDRARAI